MAKIEQNWGTKICLLWLIYSANSDLAVGRVCNANYPWYMQLSGRQLLLLPWKFLHMMEHPVLQAQVPVLGVEGLLPYQTLCHACAYYATTLVLLDYHTVAPHLVLTMLPHAVLLHTALTTLTSLELAWPCRSLGCCGHVPEVCGDILSPPCRLWPRVCTQEEPHFCIATRTPSRGQGHRLTPALLLELIVWPGAYETRHIGESGTQPTGYESHSLPLRHGCSMPGDFFRTVYVEWLFCYYSVVFLLVLHI